MRARNSVVALAALVVAVSAASSWRVSLRPPQPTVAGSPRGRMCRQNLVSDVPGLAEHTDPNLKNPWARRLARVPRSGCRTTMPGDDAVRRGGQRSTLVVSIPAPPSVGEGAVGAPTGQAFNTFDPTSSDFVISKNATLVPPSSCLRPKTETIAAGTRTVDRPHAVISVDRSTATDSAGASARSTRAWPW